MNVVRKFVEDLGVAKWPRRKKIILGIVGFVTVFLIMFAFSLYQVSSDAGNPKVNLLPNNKKPSKGLKYDFIKLDTLRLPTLPAQDDPMQSPPLTDNTYQLPVEPEKPRPKPQPSSDPRSYQPPSTPPQSAPIFSAPAGANKNPNMIVMNNMQQNQVQKGRFAGGSFGSQSAMVKVVLPDKTPVADGSIVQARVLHEAKWGDISIPKRSKMMGIASLYGSRVNIEFQEIMIGDSSHACSGRAYDLKQLQGLAYTPVNSETQQILMEELRNATTGIPVVGSITSRTTSNSNFIQEVAQLDEGLEFYVLITSVF
jgi:hypothetical protein